MKTLAFWTVTAIVTLELIAGGATDLARGRELVVAGQPVVDVLAHLGYPTYLLTILGVLKLLGAAALLAPGLPRLKEWAYAGIFFELAGAGLSHMAMGDGLDIVAPPFALAAFAVASWALRPRDRVLGVLSFPSMSNPPPVERRGVALARSVPVPGICYSWRRPNYLENQNARMSRPKRGSIGRIRIRTFANHVWTPGGHRCRSGHSRCRSAIP